MLRQIIWANQADTGLEHLSLQLGDDEILADGIVIGIEQNVSFRIRYQITCDLRWQVRSVSVESLEENGQIIRLGSDGFGNWTDESGNSAPDFRGCFDVDITATPFTNTLPIRRLGLHPGKSKEIQVVYFTVPEMQVTVKWQRYTCLQTDSARGKYKFESLDDGFTAVITVDANGLVEDYPQLFKRIWMS